MRRSQVAIRSNNYELFELAKILTIKREDEEVGDKKGGKKKELHCKFYCVKSAGWIGHAFIAAVTTNNYVILRYVGTGKVPIVRQFEWFKTDEKRNKILNMTWCPFVHHLLILTSDLTIVLVPAANLVLASNTKFGLSNIASSNPSNRTGQQVKPAPTHYKLGQPSHLGPSNDITVIASHRKTNDVHHTAHILWWRTAENYDYSITVSSRGSVRFVNLHTHVFERQASLRLANVKLVVEASIIKDSNRTYLLIQSNQEEVFQIILEQELDKGGYKNIINSPGKPPFVPAVRRGFFPEGSMLSIQETPRRGTLIGSFDPSVNKFEVYDTDLSTYALFVYQLVPGTSLVHLTDKLIFAVTYDNNEAAGTSHIYVISNLMSSTTSGSQQLYKKNHKESIMQEFRIHGEKIRGIFRAFPNQFHSIFSPNRGAALSHTELEGFLLWTRDAIYECRQKLAPEAIFFQLISQGLEKTDAEPLGKTLGLDILSLYELAADKYFENGNIGRALDLYFLSNVQTDKLVYKFLEVGRIDIVITHLRSTLKQADSLSVQDRKRLANILLHCYVQKLANYEGNNVKEAKIEFTAFLNNSTDYDKVLAAKLLLGCGLVEDMFTVWQSGLDVTEGIKILTEAGAIDLGSQALTNLRHLLSDEKHSSNNNHHHHDIHNSISSKKDQQDILLESPLFISLTPVEQVCMLLMESMRVPRYFRRIINNIPLLDEATLIAVVTFFDPLGQNMINLMQEESYSGTYSENTLQYIKANLNSGFEEIDKHRPIGQEEYLECFIIALLALCFKKNSESQVLPIYPSLSMGDFLSSSSFDLDDFDNNNNNEKQYGSSLSDLSDLGADTIADSTISSSYNSSSLSSSLSSSGPRSFVKTQSGMVYHSITSKIVKRLACGWAHSCAIVDTGELYTWGANKFGQLGLNVSDEFIATPTKVTFFQKKRIFYVSCGADHTVAITEKKETYTWGSGKSGQLGHGDKSSQLVPKLVESLRSIKMKQSACGYSHTLLISNEGRVYSCGNGKNGELGQNQIHFLATPTIIDCLEDGAEVAAGWSHSLFRTEHGEVFSWGFGVYGQLGHGNTSDVFVPKQIDELQGKRIRKIGCGSFHSTAITDLENVYTWGRGNKFRLGHGADQTDQTVPKLVNALLGKHTVSVDGGYVHTIIVTNKGEVYAWGCGNNGQLGLGNYEDTGSPQPITSLRGIKIKQVICGEEFTIVLSQEGKLYSFGSSNVGQLGVENVDRTNVPTELTFQEKISYRVLGSSNDATYTTEKQNSNNNINNINNANSINNNNNNNNNLQNNNLISENSHSTQHVYNQELLESTLKTDFMRYRPTIIIQQSIDWRNWEAASIVYQMMNDWSECFSCRLKGLSFIFHCHRNAHIHSEGKSFDLQQSRYDMSVAALSNFEHIVNRNIDEKNKRSLLQHIFTFWNEYNLNVNMLEESIKKNIVNLAQAMGELLEADPDRFPPFSSDIYLHVTNVSLKLMKKDLKKSIPVSENNCWESILENLESHLPKKNSIIINNETTEKLSKSFAKSFSYDRYNNAPGTTSDSLVFTCGHCYTKKYFYEELIVEFERKIGTMRSISTTSRFMLEDYNQKFILESCPNCLYASLLRDQNKLKK